jgi:hypothetical protein
MGTCWWSYSRNLPRAASNKRARITHTRSFEVEDEACSAVEVEEDPHDDADLTDSKDAPNGSNDGGENDLAANILDEFEDGYWSFSSDVSEETWILIIESWLFSNQLLPNFYVLFVNLCELLCLWGENFYVSVNLCELLMVFCAS